MKLTFPEEPRFKWPATFEEHLRSISYRRFPVRARSSHRPGPPQIRTRAQQGRGDGFAPPAPATGNSYRFEGVGYDDELVHPTVKSLRTRVTNV